MASANADLADGAQEISSTDLGEDATTLLQPESTTTENVAMRSGPGNIRRVESDPDAVYQRQRAAPPKPKQFRCATLP